MNTILHIGFEKTGTTTLQKYLFNTLDDVHYVGRYSEDYFRGMIDYSQGRLPSTEVNKRWAEQLDRAPENRHTVLYSREGTTSTHLSEQKEIARRHYEIFGDAKILITIRKQEDICVSRYFNAIGHGCRVEDFDDHMERGIAMIGNDYSNDDITGYKIPGPYARDQAEMWSAWKYDEIVDIWSEYFDEICVIPLEMWGHNETKVIESLAGLLDVPEHELAIPSKKTKTRSSDETISLTDEQLKEIEDVYGPGNQRLSDRFGLNLEKLGYFFGNV